MNAPTCQACGQSRELPRISPELLFFRATAPGAPGLPRRAAFLPPDLRAVAFGGQIYAMTGAEWSHFERLRAAWLRCAMPATLPAKPPKRGRPTSAARWLQLDEVADILRTDAETLARLLERAPGVLPGAILEPDGWQVPERALRVLLGAPAGPLPQYCTVADVAAALRRSPQTVYGWLQVRRADGSPLLESRRVLGSILIPAAAVLRLPATMPGARPAFFADREAARDEH